MSLCSFLWLNDEAGDLKIVQWAEGGTQWSISQ